MTNPTGYIRPRGSKLQAVIKVDGRMRWVDDRKARGKLEWPHEESHLKYFLYGPLGHLALRQVTDVVMLDRARSLERSRGPRGAPPSPTYTRKITATVRAVFKEAVRRPFIDRTPCVWEDSDLPEPRRTAGSPRAATPPRTSACSSTTSGSPEERRVLYALEFLTGLRTGEAAARSWADWEPQFLGCLGRLTAATAWNTLHRVVKTTKTRVEKWIPVHPELAAILEAWKAKGWERTFGHKPQPENLIVPAVRGGHRNVSPCSLGCEGVTKGAARSGPHRAHQHPREAGEVELAW